jgi:hypothetical protein
MKTFITALALVFALATVTTMIALTVHGDHPYLHTAGHQKMALLSLLQNCRARRVRDIV